MYTLSYGLELEFPIVSKEHELYNAQKTLDSLAKVWKEKNYTANYTYCNASILDVNRKDGTASIVAGHDCVPSIIELAIGPYNSLESLDNATSQTYNEIIDILAKDEASIINCSELPNHEVSLEKYNQLVLDKSMYFYIRDVRGHSHYAGVDGKTQLSPSVGIDTKNAINALNLILQLSPVFIALFANSPYEEGKDSTFAENRLTIWQKEFATSIYNDTLLYTMPHQLFSSWQDYFKWLFGRELPCYGLAIERDIDYKRNYDLCFLPQAPNLLSYLRKDSWTGESIRTKEKIVIKPHIKDILDQQFVQYIDARARFGFNIEDVSIKQFISAFDRSASYFDDYLNEIFSYSYIENRAPGSNSPDALLLKEAGKEVADTVHISASALQAGMLASYDELNAYLESIDYYKDYELFREEAIKNALHGKVHAIELFDFIRKVVDIAKNGLDSSQRKYLKYIEYNLDKRLCGADRLRNLISEQSIQSKINWQSVYADRYSIKYGANQ